MNKSRIPKNTQQCKNMAEVQDYIIKSNKENGTTFRLNRSQKRAAMYLRIERIFDQLPATFTVTNASKLMNCPFSMVSPDSRELFSAVIKDSFKCIQLEKGFKKP